MPLPFQKLLPFGILYAAVIHALTSDFQLVPAELQQSLPPCAYPCIEAGIVEDFSPLVCSAPATLDCFCSQYSQAGPALGDIAFQCYYTACYNQTAPSDHPAYDYCTTEQPPSTTTSPTPPSSSSTPASTTFVTALAFGNNPLPTMPDTPPVTSIDSQNPASQTSNTINTTFSGPLPAAATLAPNTAASALPASPKNAAGTLLTPGQIAGITVGVVVAAIVVYLILGTLVNCHRRKRRDSRNGSRASQNSKSSSFGNFEKPFPAPYDLEYQNRSSPSARNSPRLPAVAAESPRSVNPSQIGLAVSPESVVDPSPASAASAQSTGSTSKLIPASPPKNLKIAPQRFMPQRARPESAWTRIEDDPQMNIGSVHFPSPPQRQQSWSLGTRTDGIGLPSEPAKAAQVPMLKLRIPVRPSPAPQLDTRRSQAPKHESSQTIIQDEPQQSPPPMNATAQPAILVPRVVESGKKARSYIPSYYMQEDPPDRPPLPKAPNGIPPPPGMVRSSLPLAPSKPSRKNTRDSSASGTSIETSFSEEPTPPEEVQPALTPIVESSPLHGLRYPKVPRPSNQSVPRRSISPLKKPPDPGTSRQGSVGSFTPSHARSDSFASLVDRRKGHDAATDLQNRLWITESRGKTLTPVNPRDAWPMRSSSRAGAAEAAVQSHGRGQEMVMKSPLWEPRLAPRRGNDGDMIIDVT